MKEYILVLRDKYGTPIRTIGIFMFEDSAEQWAKDNGYDNFEVLSLEAHGLDD